jgi:predicted CXXCH cytochrome family protein
MSNKTKDWPEQIHNWADEMDNRRSKKSMRKVGFSALVSLLILGLPPIARGQKNSCIDCHKEMDEALGAPVDAFASDVHKQFGLACQDCHGGNPLEDDVELAKDKTFKGAPQRGKIPEFCGSCHADSAYMKRRNPNIRVDQLELYWTSRHGQLLKRGDTNGAVCTDCHGVHGIQTATFPKSQIFPWNVPQTCGRCHANADYMSPYGIPVNQVDEYKKSVHANALYEKKDLSAPVCNDCHGNHGAAPPEVTSIAFVCRQCHPSAGDLFSQSPHKSAFDGLGISECEACHGNHKILPPSDEMLAGGQADVCSQCHDAGTPPYEAGLEIKKRIAAFVAAIEKARGLLAEAENQGVDVSEAKFRLQEATTTLVLVRNLTHGLTLTDIEEKLGEGDQVITAVQAKGEAALEEAKFRKTGLVVATGFILLLAIALVLKIRQMRAKQAV